VGQSVHRFMGVAFLREHHRPAHDGHPLRSQRSIAWNRRGKGMRNSTRSPSFQVRVMVAQFPDGHAVEVGAPLIAMAAPWAQPGIRKFNENSELWFMLSVKVFVSASGYAVLCTTFTSGCCGRLQVTSEGMYRFTCRALASR